MSEQMIKDIKFQKASLELLDKIKNILEEYEQQGIKVTTRQIHYQLVTALLIENTKKQYNKISRLLTNARYCGIIDWEAIEDRTRSPTIPNTFSNIKELWEVAKQSYQLDRWEGQKYYVELWTEKDAISSVISPITRKYQVSMVVDRGYSSASSMYESAQRFLEHTDKTQILLYLGDHDPSGLDMDRDIQERLNEFGVDVQVIRIGLTFEQVQQYNLPENKLKKRKDEKTGKEILSDSRAKAYNKKFGDRSWEIDALKPEVLQQLIDNSILQFLDLDKYRQVQQQEKKDLEDSNA